MKDHAQEFYPHEPEMKSIPGYVKPRIHEIEKRINSRQGRNDDNDSAIRTPMKSQPNHSAGDFVSAIADVHFSTPTASSDKSAPASPTPQQQEGYRFLSSILPASNIKQVESEALKRQAEYHARVSDLEGRLALFHARLAMESAERGRDHEYTMDEVVYKPLENMMRRSLDKIDAEFIRPILDPARANETPQNEGPSILGSENTDQRSGNRGEGEGNTSSEEKKDSSDNSSQQRGRKRNSKLPNLVSIERRANLLEAQMNHHKHVTLFHAKRHHLDSIEQSFRTTLQPALTLEATKADKREGGMVRRFESSAGEYSKRLAECHASRVSALGCIQKKIDSWGGIDETYAQKILREIRELKTLVQVESEERQKQDELVVEKMLHSMNMLQEEMLAIYK
mmetsp:Transcript_9680/g.20054  ORF Transcript_9680/g.20054 Transcript_9680/m.20054 type:complete len:396 (+) Transcript_9680:113-1300(+)